MTTPKNTGRRPQQIKGANPRFDTVWRSLECVMAATIAVVISLFSYSVLLDLAAAMGLLSSTMVTFVILFTWIFVWGFIATTRDHVMGDAW
jgi:hypothetical protein